MWQAEIAKVAAGNRLPGCGNVMGDFMLQFTRALEPL